MRNRWYAVVLAIALSPSAGVAGNASRVQDLSNRKDARAAYEQLLKAPVFSIGPVGYADQLSESERALRRLLKEEDAVEILREVLMNASTLQGKMYALFGLRLKDREVFTQELKNYRDARETFGTVTTQSGCFISGEAEDRVLRKIESGHYDFMFNQFNQYKSDR